MITYGTNPAMGMAVTGLIPADADAKALEYMDFKAGEPMIGKKVDYVFVGSCTNGRIEDLRLFAQLVKGRRKAEGVTAWIVPGSKGVEAAAKAEGLDKILGEAGFELRQPGCSGLPCDERRQDSGGKILRVDIEPQLRRTSGSRRTHHAFRRGGSGGGGSMRHH